MKNPLGKQTFARGLFPLLVLLLGSHASAQLFPGAGGNPLGDNDRPRPLPMDQAFPYFVSIVDSDTLSITWQIAPDHYLYRHQFGFILQTPGDAEDQHLGYTLPQGIAKNDQFFGDVEVYYQGVTATLSTAGASLPAGTNLTIQYQGCAEWGFCYPPQSVTYSLVP
ncbi:MAG: hypothetical protein KJN90_06985 [Gammaproteobacteria bacterium]|nr:hypothetical protein [Gammaproteobacteria bacterium]